MNHAKEEANTAMKMGGAKAAALLPLPMAGDGAMLSNSTTVAAVL